MPQTGADFETANDVTLGIFDRLTVLPGNASGGQFVHMLVQRLDELAEEARAALRVGAAAHFGCAALAFSTAARISSMLASATVA